MGGMMTGIIGGLAGISMASAQMILKPQLEL